MVFRKCLTHMARELSSGILLLAVALGGCFLVLLVLGLPLYPLTGSASFDPAFGFIGDISPQLPGPAAWLGISLFYLLASSGFVRWCLSVRPVLPSTAKLPLLVRLNGPFALPASILAVPRVLIPAGMGGDLLPSPSRRMAAPSAAALSGASPLLE